MRPRRVPSLMMLVLATLAFAPQVFSQTTSEPVARKAAPPAPESLENSNEENLLRLAYGRLSLYVKAGHGYEAVKKNRAYSVEGELRFELQNIHTGPIEEILDKPYGSLTAKPTGQVVRISRSQYSLADGPQHILYQSGWVVSHYNPTMLEEWDRTTLREVMRQIGDQMADIDKYTSYEVTLSLDGRQRTYRAI